MYLNSPLREMGVIYEPVRVLCIMALEQCENEQNSERERETQGS